MVIYIVYSNPLVKLVYLHKNPDSHQITFCKEIIFFKEFFLLKISALYIVSWHGHQTYLVLTAVSSSKK